MTRKPISKGLRFDVLSRDGFRCRYCGASSEVTELHIDHYLPVALGGDNSFDNLVTACVACNLGKRTKIANLETTLDFDGVYCPFAEGWPNDIEDPVYFLNEQWAVTEYGLEAVEHFYPICSDRLDEVIETENGRMSSWLAHMAQKIWVFRKADLFREAFLLALKAHGVQASFDVPKSLKAFDLSCEMSRRQYDLWRDQIDDDLADDQA